MTLRLPIRLAMALAASLFVAGAHAQEGAPPAAPATEPPPAPAPQQPEPQVAPSPPVAPAPYYQSPTPYYGPSPYAQPKLHRGMLITGLSIFGGAYTLAVLIGSDFQDESDSCADCKAAAPYMYIPLVGPFLASGAADSGTGALVFMGIVQVVGAGLTVGGAIRLKRSKDEARRQGFLVWEHPAKRRLFLEPFTSTRSAGLNLRLSL